MKKSTSKLKPVWNKGRVVGPASAFMPSDVERFRRLLGGRGPAGYRDLALFNLAIDTMISVTEVLQLTVGDVKLRNGAIKSVLVIRRSRGKTHICGLSTETASALKQWLASSGLRGSESLFPGRGEPKHSLTSRQVNRLVKEWTADAGLDPAKFGIESLRRAKAAHILNSTGDLETVRVLLGHAKIESTARFLQLSRKAVDPIAIARAHDF